MKQMEVPGKAYYLKYTARHSGDEEELQPFYLDRILASLTSAASRLKKERSTKATKLPAVLDSVGMWDTVEWQWCGGRWERRALERTRSAVNPDATELTEELAEKAVQYVIEVTV